MALRLYIGSQRYSSWSLRPYLALAQSGLAHDVEKIELRTPGFKAKILAVSPSGFVPVLRDGELAVHDSLAICEYVAELAPAAQLWPADRASRARARAVSAEMHSGFGALRREMPMDLGVRRPGVGHTEAALADARRVMTMWSELLAASGGPFLFGPFTIVDAMYAPVATRFETYGVELDAVCRGYAAALDALPAMQRWRTEAASEPERPPL